MQSAKRMAHSLKKMDIFFALLSSLFSMLYALCSMRSALFAMLYALCSMPLLEVPCV